MSYLLRGALDRLLLIVAFVAGGLLPGFVAQYRQRLGGRLDQALRDLAPWQSLADQRYHGDLHALIQYHLASSDPTFHADGLAIESIADSVRRLQGAVDALHAGLVHQLSYLALHLDADLARATWRDWIPAFSLSTGGIVFALVFALILWLLFQGVWSLLSMFGKRRGGRKHIPAGPARAQRGV